MIARLIDLGVTAAIWLRERRGPYALAPADQLKRDAAVRTEWIAKHRRRS